MALAGVLCLSGCAVVVIGHPSALAPPTRDAGGEITVVGAGGDDVDVVARNALADLEQFWTEHFPDVFGLEFTLLQGGYFSVDPGLSDPRGYPDGVGCGADLLEAENNAFYCRSDRAPHSDSITYDRSFLGELAGEYGRFIPALVMAHAGRRAVVVHRDRDAGRLPGRCLDRLGGGRQGGALPAARARAGRAPAWLLPAA
jgi:hypothetical protein